MHRLTDQILQFSHAKEMKIILLINLSLLPYLKGEDLLCEFTTLNHRNDISSSPYDLKKITHNNLTPIKRLDKKTFFKTASSYLTLDYSNWN